MRGPTYAFFLFASLLASAGTAHAGEKEVCLAASDQAQRARAGGKLVEAKEKFAVCAREVCPPVVRQDCATWQDEVSKSLPTVSVGVRDQDGHDLLDVKIFVDGQLVTEHLDGKSFPVDPGTHVIRAEDGTHPAIEERVLVKEGEKARAINLRIVTTTPKSAGGAGAPQDTPPPPESPSTSRSPLPFVLIGVGAATFGTGIALHFVGKGSFPDNCRADADKVEGRDGTCTPTAEDPTGQKSGEDAMSAVNLRNAGTALAVGGGAVFLGGLVWFFVDTPSKKKAQSTRILPSVGPGYAGLGLSGRF